MITRWYNSLYTWLDGRDAKMMEIADDPVQRKHHIKLACAYRIYFMIFLVIIMPLMIVSACFIADGSHGSSLFGSSNGAELNGFLMFSIVILIIIPQFLNLYIYALKWIDSQDSRG